MTEVTTGDYDAVLGLNLKSAFFVAQAAAKRMIAQGVAGSLIHIGSQMGHVGAPNRSLYCASKWALEGMNKAIARSEEHTSELQSLMRISYAVFCLKKKTLLHLLFQNSYVTVIVYIYIHQYYC